VATERLEAAAALLQHLEKRLVAERIRPEDVREERVGRDVIRPRAEVLLLLPVARRAAFAARRRRLLGEAEVSVEELLAGVENLGDRGFAHAGDVARTGDGVDGDAHAALSGGEIREEIVAA